MEGRFLGRDVVHKPSCPFCSSLIEQPKELIARMPHEMPLGKCSCGAVYACDIIGHNLGNAMIDALVFACGGDWDLAWGLLPEEDYLEKRIHDYDLESHLIVPSRAYQGRGVNGVLLFIRLHEDVREVTDKGVQRQFDIAQPIKKTGDEVRKGKRTFSKKEVEKLVNDFQVGQLLQYAELDTRIIRALQRLLYSVDRLTSLKASDILGRASAVIARRDPGLISRLLQGFITSLQDTAASSWGSLDALGEVISRSPDLFGGYVHQMYRFVRDPILLPELIRALGRIAQARPDLIQPKGFYFVQFLKDSNPEVRGYSSILFSKLNVPDARDTLKELTGDSEKIEIYKDGNLKEMTIGMLAEDAISRMIEHGKVFP
jgi:hypothetical protein